jgi:hypothetical protein
MTREQRIERKKEFQDWCKKKGIEPVVENCHDFYENRASWATMCTLYSLVGVAKRYDPGMSEAEILEAHTAFSNAIKQGITSGLVKRVGRGFYQVATQSKPLERSTEESPVRMGRP